jgi:hypothetical protein
VVGLKTPFVDLSRPLFLPLGLASGCGLVTRSPTTFYGRISLSAFTFVLELTKAANLIQTLLEFYEASCSRLVVLLSEVQESVPDCLSPESRSIGTRSSFWETRSEL